MLKILLSRHMCLCLAFLAVIFTGCSEEDKKGIALVVSALHSDIAQVQHAQKMYQRPDWKAEEYFDDPKVINLCNAVRNRDVALIDRLIAEGADVNAQGVGNMTPLLWAFVQGRPWKKPPSLFQQNKSGFSKKWATEEFDAMHLAIFTKLLEHGADPNVQFTATFFETNNHAEAGLPHMPITRVVRFLALPYFETVMQHGGNPHLYYSIREPIAYVDPVVTEASLSISNADLLKKLQHVINAGVDIDQADAERLTPLALAVQGGNYDMAIMLIEAGADWLVAHPESPNYLASIVAFLVRQSTENFQDPEQYKSYRKLIEILEEKGADFELERKIWRPGQIALSRMNIDEARLVIQELKILEQKRRELYERIQKKELPTIEE